MKRLWLLTAVFSALCPVALLPAAAGAAEVRIHPAAVLELFTSQSCSSCPPADKILSSLGERDDVIALAYHVDYWDYTGWADTFGKPEHSNLQRAYAASWGKKRIYTPQLVINGNSGIVGSRRAQIDVAISQASLSVPVMLEVNGGMLDVSITSNEAADCGIWLVKFKGEAEVVIERGENRGQTLAYGHIVTSRQLIGMLEHGSGSSARFKLPLSAVFGAGNDGIAILVQEHNGDLPGPVAGAASLVQ